MGQLPPTCTRRWAAPKMPTCFFFFGALCAPASLGICGAQALPIQWEGSLVLPAVAHKPLALVLLLSVALLDGPPRCPQHIAQSGDCRARLRGHPELGVNHRVCT